MNDSISRQTALADSRAAGQDEIAHPHARSPLSEREMEVARLLVTGASNSEIARILVISPHTVKVHLRNIFEKLQVSSRTEAGAVLLQRGWVTLPGVEIDPAPRIEPVVAEPAQPVEQPLPPLADLQGVPRVWQWALVGATALLCLVGLLLLWRVPPPKAALPLLSDSTQPVLGPPVIESLARWTLLAPLPRARSRAAAAQIGATIYVVGGEDAKGYTLADFSVYDVAADRWRAAPPLPAPRANAAVVAHNGALLVLGGSVLDVDSAGPPRLYADLLRFDPARQTWSYAGELPGPRAGAGAVLLGEMLYLVGGWDGAAPADGVFALPVHWLGAGAVPADAWQPVATLPEGLVFMGVAVLDGELVVAGGYNGRREVAQVLALDHASRQWRRLPDLSIPRSGHHVVHDGVSLLAVGGGWTQAVNYHERLDQAAGTWVTVPSPMRGQWRHAAVTTDSGNVYFIGGWSGDYLATTVRFQSTFRALLPAIPNLGN